MKRLLVVAVKRFRPPKFTSLTPRAYTDLLHSMPLDPRIAEHRALSRRRRQWPLPSPEAERFAELTRELATELVGLTRGPLSLRP